MHIYALALLSCLALALCQSCNKTLGTTNVRGSMEDACNSLFIVGSLFTTDTKTGMGPIVAMSSYVGNIAPNAHYMMAIYNTSRSTPTELLGATTIGALVPYSWNTLAISDVMLYAGYTYLLAFMSDGDSCTQINDLYFETTSSIQSVGTVTFSFGAFPATWPGSDLTGKWVYSIQAQYGCQCVQVLGNDDNTTGIQDTCDAPYIVGSSFTTDCLCNSGGLHSMYAYIAHKDPSSSGQHYQMAVYSDSGGVPNTLLGTTNIGSGLVCNAWNSLSLGNVPVEANTTYWLVFTSSSKSCSMFNDLVYDSTTSSTAFKATDYTFGQLQTTFNYQKVTYYSRSYTIYAGYMC